VSRRIVQLVPRLGTRLDAVADYARALDGALAAHGIATAFLRGDPADAGDASPRVASRSAEALATAVEALHDAGADRTVLLHYVNYAYEPRGCPRWLIEGLERWKRRPGTRLVTMFHELYASGPPWRSSFWLSPVQRSLAAHLVRSSDAIFTNCGLYRDRIAAMATNRGVPIHCHPVFSTLGEPAEPSSWAARPATMAILGRPGAALRAYGKHRDALVATARALGVGEIVDIGPRDAKVPEELGGLRVRSLGELSAGDISQLLSRCRVGVLDYPSDVLGKSTVFAAYAAHGVVPVITRFRDGNADGLRDGGHFVVARERMDRTYSTKELEAVSQAVSQWYAPHSLERQAAALSGILP